MSAWSDFQDFLFSAVGDVVGFFLPEVKTWLADKVHAGRISEIKSEIEKVLKQQGSRQSNIQKVADLVNNYVEKRMRLEATSDRGNTNVGRQIRKEYKQVKEKEDNAKKDYSKLVEEDVAKTAIENNAVQSGLNAISSGAGGTGTYDRALGQLKTISKGAEENV